MKKALIVSGGLLALLLLIGFGGPALFPGAALSVAVRVERGLSHVEKKQVSIQGLTMPYLVRWLYPASRTAEPEPVDPALH